MAQLSMAVALFLAYASSTAVYQKENELLAKAQAAWAAYQEQARQFQGHGTIVTSRLDAALRSVTNISSKRGSNALVGVSESYQEGLDQHSSVRTWEAFGINAKYSFLLKKKDHGLWVVTLIQPRSAGVPKDINDGFLPGEEPPRPLLLRISHSLHLPTLTQRKDFVVRRAVAEGRLMRFHFDCPSAHVRGDVQLDTECSWCLKSAEVEHGLRKISAEYSYSEEEMPSTVACVTRTTAPGPEGKLVEWVERIELNHGIPNALPPETDFTLSAFGLPEPFGVTWERPTPWWLYALISAGMLFVVAVIVSFRKRRLAARQAG